MQLVIDIPEGAYKLLKNEGVDWLGAEHILNAVANGTPLENIISSLESKLETEVKNGVDHMAKVAHNCGINEAIEILRGLENEDNN